MGKRRPAACPPVPKHRKSFGTAVNVDNDLLLHTAGEMDEYGVACFRAGWQAAVAFNSKSRASTVDSIQNDEDRWADYRSGRASRPKA